MDALLQELRRCVSTPKLPWLSLGIVLLVVGIWYYSGPEIECDDEDGLLQEIWDDDLKEASMLGTSLANSTVALSEVGPRLEQYAREWASAYSHACQVEQEDSIKIVCLRDQRRDLLATMRLLADIGDSEGVEEEVVEHTASLVHHLPEPSRCDRISRFMAERDFPNDPEVEDRIRLLQQRLKSLASLENNELIDQRLLEVEDIVKQADDLGFKPLQVLAWFRRGTLRSAKGMYVKAEKDFQRAYRISLRNGYDEMAAKSLDKWIFVVGYKQARYIDALILEDTAFALSRREPSDPLIEASVHNSVGLTLRERGDLQPALEHFKDALKIYEPILDASDPRLASSLRNIGLALQALGKSKEGLIFLERALSIEEKVD